MQHPCRRLLDFIIHLVRARTTVWSTASGSPRATDTNSSPATSQQATCELPPPPPPILRLPPALAACRPSLRIGARAPRCLALGCFAKARFVSASTASRGSVLAPVSKPVRFGLPTTSTAAPPPRPPTPPTTLQLHQRRGRGPDHGVHVCCAIRQPVHKHPPGRRVGALRMGRARPGGRAAPAPLGRRGARLRGLACCLIQSGGRELAAAGRPPGLPAWPHFMHASPGGTASSDPKRHTTTHPSLPTYVHICHLAVSFLFAGRQQLQHLLEHPHRQRQAHHPALHLGAARHVGRHRGRGGGELARPRVLRRSGFQRKPCACVPPGCARLLPRWPASRPQQRAPAVRPRPQPKTGTPMGWHLETAGPVWPFNLWMAQRA